MNGTNGDKAWKILGPVLAGLLTCAVGASVLFLNQRFIRIETKIDSIENLILRHMSLIGGVDD